MKNLKAAGVNVVEDDSLDNPAESVFNCSISTTSKAINIHATGYEGVTDTIANAVIKEVVAGFKKLTIDAAKAKREADKKIEEDIIAENTVAEEGNNK